MRNLHLILFALLIGNVCMANRFENRTVFVKDSVVPELTVSYELIATGATESNAGIGESYNGGQKTVFVSGKLARVRMASLMRIQSVFLFPVRDPEDNRAIMLKESGKEKYQYNLTGAEWAGLHEKYDSASIELTAETMEMLGYTCRKAIVRLNDGKEIVAWYTDTIENDVFRMAEPALALVPGIVLQYSYAHPKGTITFRGSSISTRPIAPGMYVIPYKGYTLKKFIPGKRARTVDSWEDDEN